MPLITGHSLRLVVVSFAIAVVSLVACEDASSTQEQPAQPATEAASTNAAASSPAAADLTNETLTDDADSTSEDDMIDYEDSPHLDNRQTITIEDKWKRLGKNQIWINHEEKRVMVRGRICLQEGPLEMFACPGSTKAHESVIASEAPASEIHAGLVALGFPPGKPAHWDPEYTPAHGPLVKILVGWQDGDEFVQVNAREMVKASGTDKPLEKDWVFGGSQIYVDNVSGENIYYADSGEMVCLSNFSTAMLDVQVESSNAADGLVFEANKEKIPPPNTKVYMIFVPRKAETKPAGASSKETETKDDDSPDK